MGFQDVAFLLSRGSFLPHFLKIVVEVKALGPPRVSITVVGGRQGHSLGKILFLQRNLFLCQLNFLVIMRLS